jgi:hypothetical protein
MLQMAAITSPDPPRGRLASRNDFIDAFEDEEGAALPVDGHLTEIVPTPAPADTDKLEEEATRHRVLLVRGGAVIAITTLIAVGGALLIHFFIASIVAVGLLFPWFSASTNSGGGNGREADLSPAAFSIPVNDVEPSGPPSQAATPAIGTPNAVLPAPPALAPLPETSSRDMTAQLLQTNLPPLPDNTFGSVRVLANLPAQAATTAGNPSGNPAARGIAASNGEAPDGEQGFNWVPGGGSGKGRGAGSGIDRGMSAADRKPQLLAFNGGTTALQLPLKYQIKPPERSVKFNLTIAPDGSIAAIHLEQSCGIAEVDALAESYIQGNLRFSPAYKAGKAVAGEFPFEISFKPFD